MATETFKLMVQAFLRDNNEGLINITLGNPTTSFSPTPQRYKFDGVTGDSVVYDYFWLAGVSLFRAIDKYTKGDILRLLPGFRKEKTGVTLTSGSYSLLPADKIERILNPIILTVSGSSYQCNLANPEQATASKVAIATSSTKRRKPTISTPLYYIENGAIKVITNTLTQSGTITFSYISSVPRIMLNSTSLYNDIWTDNWSDMLIEGATMLAKRTNSSELTQMYFNQLQTKYKSLEVPSVNVNNTSQIERQ